MNLLYPRSIQVFVINITILFIDDDIDDHDNVSPDFLLNSKIAVSIYKKLKS